MRLKNSIMNSISAVLTNIVTMIIGFIAQALFIKMLGAEYLGLNGLFANIVSMLAIAELGIGNAIIFNLYKPLADNDINKIKALMNFYKKSYRFISLIVILISLLIYPFLTKIVGNITIDVNLNFVYFLFITSAVASYILSYKRSILYADQKKYIINYIHIGYLVLLNFFQLLFLYITKNFYIYLIIKIIFQLLENIIITIYVNKKYKYLNNNNNNKLDSETEKSIFVKIKALFLHKIGTFVVWGTDNIIISSFLGVIYVGLYSNYNLILNALNNLFVQFINSTAASVGNLLTENNCEKNYKVFKKMKFINYWIATYSSIAFLLIIQPFITIWIGDKYLLSMFIVVILVFNYYQKIMRSSYETFKESAGIWYEDRFVPLVESILNIVFSIICLKIFGLAGVFMGTIISGFILWFYSYPKFVYKKIFNKDKRKYYFDIGKYLLVFIIILIITSLIGFGMRFNNIIVNIIYRFGVSLIVPNFLIFLLFRKTEEFEYLKNIVLNFIKKYIRDGSYAKE